LKDIVQERLEAKHEAKHEVKPEAKPETDVSSSSSSTMPRMGTFAQKLQRWKEKGARAALLSSFPVSESELLTCFSAFFGDQEAVENFEEVPFLKKKKKKR